MTRDDEIEEVLNLVRPGKEHDRVRQHIINSISRIEALKPDVAPPGAARRQLGKVVSALKKARAAINSLPPTWCRQLDPETFLGETNRIVRTGEDLAKNMRVRRSGGAPPKRAAAAQKLVAAELAFDLINGWGDHSPALTKSGDFQQLAGLLFKIATGRPSGDMERACAIIFKDLQKDGFPDAAERRRIARAGRSGWKNAPEYLLKLTKENRRQTAKK